MNRLLLAVALCTSSSCYPREPDEAEKVARATKQMRHLSAGRLPCLFEDITIEGWDLEQVYSELAGAWSASCRGRRWACSSRVLPISWSGIRQEVNCAEVGAPAAHEVAP